MTGNYNFEFYVDLVVHIFKKNVVKSNFSEQFRKLINRYKRIGYSLDIIRQTACLVVNPIIVDDYEIVAKSNFSEQFRKLINRYKRIGYSLDIMRQTACLVVNPIIVDGFTSLFNCTTAVRASDSMTASS